MSQNNSYQQQGWSFDAINSRAPSTQGSRTPAQQQPLRRTPSAIFDYNAESHQTQTSGPQNNPEMGFGQRYQQSRDRSSVSITNRRLAAPATTDPEMDCSVCAETLPASRFPTAGITRTCAHAPSTCRGCLASSMRSDMETRRWTQLNCPECGEALAPDDVERYADLETLQRYRILSRRANQAEAPNFRYCAECGHGQNHEPGAAQPLVVCKGCGARTCFRHEIKWHNRLTCEEFDHLMKGEALAPASGAAPPANTPPVVPRLAPAPSNPMPRQATPPMSPAPRQAPLNTPAPPLPRQNQPGSATSFLSHMRSPNVPAPARDAWGNVIPTDQAQRARQDNVRAPIPPRWDTMITPDALATHNAILAMEKSDRMFAQRLIEEEEQRARELRQRERSHLDSDFALAESFGQEYEEQLERWRERDAHFDSDAALAKRLQDETVEEQRGREQRQRDYDGDFAFAQKLAQEGEAQLSRERTEQEESDERAAQSLMNKWQEEERQRRQRLVQADDFDASWALARKLQQEEKDAQESWMQARSATDDADAAYARRLAQEWGSNAGPSNQAQYDTDAEFARKLNEENNPPQPRNTSHHDSDDEMAHRLYEDEKQAQRGVSAQHDADAEFARRMHQQEQQNASSSRPAPVQAQFQGDRGFARTADPMDRGRPVQSQASMTVAAASHMQQQREANAQARAEMARQAGRVQEDNMWFVREQQMRQQQRPIAQPTPMRQMPQVPMQAQTAPPAQQQEEEDEDSPEAIRRMFLRRQRENEASEQTVAEISKPCPQCRVPIQRVAGCQHMTCTRCNQQFCWICGKIWIGGENGGGGCVSMPEQCPLSREGRETAIAEDRMPNTVYHDPETGGDIRLRDPIT